MSYLDYLFPKTRSQAVKLVLVVEDDAFMRSLFTHLFAIIDPSFAVHCVSGSDEAKQAMRSNRIALIISDCMLGAGESGMGFWSYCKTHHPKTPFLMATGLSASTLDAMASNAKVAPPAVLQKPFLLRDLKSRLADLLPVKI